LLCSAAALLAGALAADEHCCSARLLPCLLVLWLPMSTAALLWLLLNWLMLL